MSPNNITIRDIEAKDNAQVEAIIRACFIEYKLPLVCTAYADEETKHMHKYYQNKKEGYFVIANNENVYGGAGIKPLKNFKGNVCELQKMYFSPEIRGKGFGKKLFAYCLKAAKEYGYESCYLESASQLKAAIHIYESYGFTHLDKPLGNTGHYSCGVWMIKPL